MPNPTRLLKILLLTTGLLLAGCPEPTAPARVWRLGYSDAPTHQALAEQLAERVNRLSAGRLQLQPLALDGAARLERVSSGALEMGLGQSAEDALPAAVFFGAQPFGLSASQYAAWLQHGGQALWEQTYGPYGVLPLALEQEPLSLGLWSDRELGAATDLLGMTVRQPGLLGELLQRLGARVEPPLAQDPPQARISQGLPQDEALGLHRGARYYYPWPGRAAAADLLINQQAYQGLPADLQAIVREASRGLGQQAEDDALYQCALALERLRLQGVLFSPLPAPLQQRLRQESASLLAEHAARDPLNGRIWASQSSFQALLLPLQPLETPAP
ncbi:MAG: ABC transporter substrate-binding protein [Pseudomonas sp.]|uniref:ABC transporter substrate-binding protein n=1 Tax=Pseudomonas sp. TaxID=306 RepID=UPI0033966DFC